MKSAIDQNTIWQSVTWQPVFAQLFILYVT